MKHIYLIVLTCLLIKASPLLAQIQIGSDITGVIANDQLGQSVSLSADGSRMAVGVPQFDGLPGLDCGQVLMYEFNNSTNAWELLGNPIIGESASDFSGFKVSLSGDGNRVAIGAINNDGGGPFSGHARVFEWDGSSWNQLGADLDGEASLDRFSTSLSLSSNGQRVAVGSPANAGFGSESGQVRVFEWQGTDWVQLGMDLDGESMGDRSGESVSLSADGSRVAIGAPKNDGGGSSSGHVSVFEFQLGSWIKVGGDIDGALGDEIGRGVSLSFDGNRVAVGALNAGVRVYDFDGISWNQVGPEIPKVSVGDFFGNAISISANGDFLAIGAPFHDVGMTATSNEGLVRVFEFTLGSWQQLSVDLVGENAGDNFGVSVALSADGSRLAAGAPLRDGSVFNVGLARAYENLSVSLPIRLLGFRADVGEDAILLSGQVNSDTFLEEVLIQHSLDGRNWQNFYSAPIRDLLDSSGSRFEFPHKDPGPGINFYRFREWVGEDAIDLAPVISAYWDPELALRVYPNPTQDFLYLEGSTEGIREIWDTRGNLMASFPSATQRISLQGFAPGMYLLIIKNREASRSFKIIKQ